jgi:hypothetical protein
LKTSRQRVLQHRRQSRQGRQRRRKAGLARRDAEVEEPGRSAEQPLRRGVGGNLGVVEAIAAVRPARTTGDVFLDETAVSGKLGCSSPNGLSYLVQGDGKERLMMELRLTRKGP